MKHRSLPTVSRFLSPILQQTKQLHAASCLTLFLLCAVQSYYITSLHSSMCIDGLTDDGNIIPSFGYSYSGKNKNFSDHRQQRQQYQGESYDYCVIQITSKQGFVERKDANFQSPSSEFSQFHVYINKYGKIVGSLNFDALESAFLERQTCSLNNTKWLFIGDDDTLFYDKGIQRFMKQRYKQETKLYAHGNFFNPRKPYEKSWYNGGSGIAVSGKVVQLLLQNTTKNNPDLARIIQREEEDCHCGDVPFARVLQYFRVRTIHQPTLFLDSCMDCNTMDVANVDIVSCHGATLFREINPQANDKALHMKDLYSNYFSEAQLRKFGEYKQPDFFANMTLLERRQYFDASCKSI
eukprot:scaffold1192_cov58-Cylindrotheca_fusiformis.AAC.15